MNSRTINDFLTQDCFNLIFDRFSVNELNQLSLVCKHWHSLIRKELYGKRKALVIVAGNLTRLTIDGIDFRGARPKIDPPDSYHIEGGPLYSIKSFQLKLKQVTEDAMIWVNENMPNLEKIEVVSQYNDYNRVINDCDEFYERQLCINYWRYTNINALEVYFTSNEELRAGRR